MKHLKSITIAALGVALIASAPMVFAQNDPRDQNIPSLELEQAPVHDALKILFRVVGASYSVAPEVQGSVTVHMKDKPFETCLNAILKQVNATFKMEGGVYYVFLKPAETAPGTGPETPPDVAAGDGKSLYRLKIKHADPYVVYLLLRGEMGITQGRPEISATLIGGGGGGGFGGGQGFGGQGGFGGGGLGGGGFGGSQGGFGGGGFGGGGFGGGGFGGGGFGGGGFGGGGFGGGNFGGGGGGFGGGGGGRG